MSAKKETTSGRNLDDWQQSWYENTRVAREQEDVKFNEEYDVRRTQLRSRLVDLYDRRSQLENDLQSIQAGIVFQEEQQELLLREYDETRRRIASQRLEEDRTQQEWYERSREVSHGGAKDNRPRSNGRRASIREMGNPQIANAANAAGGWISINGARPGRKGAHREDEEEPPTDPGNLLSSGYQPMDDAETNGRALAVRTSANRSRPDGSSNGVDMDIDDPEAAIRPRKDGERPLKPKQRHSLPSFSAVVRSPAPKPKQESPDEGKPRSASGRRSLPGVKAQQSETPVPDENEINRDTVTLKHNGSIYTEPPMYYGVPVERISPTHQYWDPEWQPLEDVIMPQLEKWQEKLDTLRRTPEAVRHTVFLANRQVNRGQAVIDFLKDGDFHPYQYVGKEMMSKFYKTFINYDTMFRLVNVHEELKKFDLDVTPLDWLRQRMHEVSSAQGDRFSLSKYTHDLYHDGKLKTLREKHGFGNIGRPSGYKVGDKNPDKTGKTKGKRESSGGTIRRKARRSIGQVDIEEPSMLDGIHQQQPQEYLEPVTPRLQKRPRVDTEPTSVEPIPQSDEELDYEGYTSTDSFSAGRIMHLDWRVYQIKTPSLTTSTEVTQYWTWKADKGIFEHQVLRDVYPKVTWGYYQKPINFDLALEQITEIQFANRCQMINVLVRDDERGNVLAYFKRDRTKRRFISFARKKGVKLVKQTAVQIEESWNTMKSKTLPDEDSEA